MVRLLPNPTCVLKVGDGRGFIVEHHQELPPFKPAALRKLGITKQILFENHRLIVTAAHCLPRLPLAHAPSYDGDRLYLKLLGSLHGAKPKVSAECLFVDPVADIAVLGCPDDQEMGELADSYHELTGNAPILQIENARSGKGWVLSLDGQWVRTTLDLASGVGALLIDPTESGMSGSPILNDAGRAVGVVVIGTETSTGSGERKNLRAGPQPKLTHNLPGWLLKSQQARTT